MSTHYYQYRNLVFEGGGVKGVAYGGALEVLEQSNITPQIENVAGTSAGAITATMVSLNYDAAAVINLMMSLPFKKFEDGDLAGGPFRLVEHYGWFKGDFFLNWMQDRIADKTGGDGRATFHDLYAPDGKYAAKRFKPLRVFGTNLSQQISQEFSLAKSPGMAVADAVRISMSIPFFFEARTYNGDVFCDGGVLDNYPISAFDDTTTEPDPQDASRTYLVRTPNEATLGFHLDNFDQPTPRPVSNVVRFAGGVFDALLNIQNILLKTSPGDEQRTVFINDLGVSTTDFNLSDETKWRLIRQGRIATANYLSTHPPGRPPLPKVVRLLRRDDSAARA